MAIHSTKKPTNPSMAAILWSGRVTLRVQADREGDRPISIWEHFQENDDRVRSAKQLCKKDPGRRRWWMDPPLVTPDTDPSSAISAICRWRRAADRLRSTRPTAFQTPNAGARSVHCGVAQIYLFRSQYPANQSIPMPARRNRPICASIDSLIDPTYRAKNDTFEFNTDYDVTPRTDAHVADRLQQGLSVFDGRLQPLRHRAGLFRIRRPCDGTLVGQDGEYCDPQLGCSDRLVGQDLSQEQRTSFPGNASGVEFRRSVQFQCRRAITCTIRRWKTIIVFVNAITALVTEYFNHCIRRRPGVSPIDAPHIPFDPVHCEQSAARNRQPIRSFRAASAGLGCAYIDPNPISRSTDRATIISAARIPIA